MVGASSLGGGRDGLLREQAITVFSVSRSIVSELAGAGDQYSQCFEVQKCLDVESGRTFQANLVTRLAAKIEACVLLLCNDDKSEHHWRGVVMPQDYLPPLVKSLSQVKR